MTEVPDERRERIAADPYCETLGIDLTDLGPGRATAEEVHAGGRTAAYGVVVADESGDRVASFRGRVYES